MTIEFASSIRLEGDKRAALELVPEGKLLLQKVISVAKNAGVDTFSMNRRVSDLATIYALYAGGRGYIHINVDTETNESETGEEEYDPALTPNFLSGLVFNGIADVAEKDGKKFRVLRSWEPNAACARVSKLKTGRQSSKRLAVPVPGEFKREWGSPGDTVVFTQTRVPKPSMWSGLMAKVVQVLFGLGRINPAMLRDPNVPGPLPKYAEDIKATGVQVRYDYRFMRTHGIYKNEKELWLVEISAQNGVLAMPLPIFPGSDSEKFRKDATKNNDTNMVTALDAIGALPTGEAFPTGRALQKKIASGDILRLKTVEEMREFYDKSAYSSALGWAFSPSGSEAHNTAYSYDSDGVQYGYWYQLSISLSTNKKREQGGPIGSGSAQLTIQRRGALYTPPGKYSFLPFKFHEPLIGGLLSHSAPAHGSSIPDCDTPMFVTFVNGSLKVASFYRVSKQDVIDSTEDSRTPGECMYEGSWTIHTISGSRSIPPMAYTNDIDPREVLSTTESTTKITVSPMGFDPPKFGDYIEAPEGCFVTRNKVFREHTTSETKMGSSKNSMFMWPDKEREGYYFFVGKRYDGGRSGMESVKYLYLRDPNTYFGWRKLLYFGSIPWPQDKGCSRDVCGGKHTNRKIVCYDHIMDGACQEFADSGGWAGICDDIESLCSASPPVRTPWQKLWDKGTDFKGDWYYIGTGVFGQEQGEHSAEMHGSIMNPSPAPDTGFIQYMYAGHSALGEDCAFHMKGYSGGMLKVGSTSVKTESDDGLPTFIGVNT